MPRLRPGLLLGAALLLSGLTACNRAQAADSPYLYGIHWWGYTAGQPIDNVPAALLDCATHGGWDLETVLTHSASWWAPSHFTGLYQDLYANKRMSIITRIDYDWGQTVPAPSNPNYTAWPNSVVAAVNTLRHGCHLWVLGNEPNIIGEGNGWPDGKVTPAGYAAIYRAVRNKMLASAQASPAGPHRLLIAAPSPGGIIAGVRWIDGNDWLGQVIDNIPASEIDGFAIHSYGGSLADFHNGYVSQLAVIDSKGLYTRPVYMTEWNRITDTANTADEANTAQFCRDAFADVAAWNAGNGHHNIVCLCWFVYDANNQAGGGWNGFAVEYWKGHGIYGPGDSRDLFTAFQQTVDLRYPAGIAGTRGPVLVRWPGSLTQSTLQGSAAANSTLTVQNTGTDTMNYTVSGNVSWLSFSPAAGASTGEQDTISVIYSSATLPVGTHAATITIAAPGAVNPTQTVAVSLTVVPRPIPGDMDDDRDVDAEDLRQFRLCLTGTDIGPPTSTCTRANLDGDNDVDQADFGRLQRCITGPYVDGDPDC